MDHVVKLKTTRGCFEYTIQASKFAHLDTDPNGSNKDVIPLFIGAQLSILADSPLASSGVLNISFRRLVKHINQIHSRANIKEYILELAHLGDYLSKLNLDNVSHDLLKDREGYELSRSIISKEFVTYLKTRDPRLFQYMISFLWFGKKMHYIDPEFNAAAFRSWLEVEDRLSGLTFDTDVLLSLKHIVGLLLGPHKMDFSLYPRFGPGSVAERKVFGPISKSNTLDYDPYIDRAFFRGHFANYGLSGESGFVPSKVIPNHWEWNANSKTCKRVARLHFAPKNVKTARSVCMEPNTIMFFQQAVLDALTSRMSRNLIGRFVNLHDQVRNTELAMYGSGTGRIDTIDLSRASDSVSIDLVKGIFPRDVLYYLIATRTKVVQHGNEQYRVKKFAPMGSALCFPVQCIVFTACSVLAAIADECECSTGSLPTSRVVTSYTKKDVDELFRESPGPRLNPHSYEPLAVYGDDICIDSRLTDRLISLLTSLGFEINISKSFTRSDAFRESCGVFALRGVDVTPILHRVQHFVGDLNVAAVASMSDMANRAFRAKYPSLRRFLVRVLLYGDIEGAPKLNGCNSFTFLRPEEYSLGQLPPALTMWSTAGKINHHLRWRYYGTDKVRNDFQRDEYQSLCLVPKHVVEPKSHEVAAYENYKYLAYQRAHRGGPGPEFISGPRNSLGVTRDTRLARRWIPD